MLTSRESGNSTGVGHQQARSVLSTLQYRLNDAELGRGLNNRCYPKICFLEENGKFFFCTLSAAFQMSIAAAPSILIG